MVPELANLDGGQALGCKRVYAYRKWTPECILATAFKGIASTNRSALPTQASSASADSCLKLVSSCVDEGQKSAMASIREKSHVRELDFFITNNMHDETKLYFGFSKNEGPAQWLGTARSHGKKVWPLALAMTLQAVCVTWM